MNILIPCAGRSSRFREKGLEIPKFLIDVDGKVMLQRVVENIGIEGRYIFCFLQEHIEKHDLENLVRGIVGDYLIIPVNEITQGPACTCMLAQEYINNFEPLILADCDYLSLWDRNAFLRKCKDDYEAIEGITMVFESRDPKNSYVRLSPDGDVMEVAEKRVIGEYATTGFHYYTCGIDFVNSVKEMIAERDTANGEFYVAPAFNYMIKAGYKIHAMRVQQHFPLGVPDDLSQFLTIIPTSPYDRKMFWRELGDI